MHRPCSGRSDHSHLTSRDRKTASRKTDKRLSGISHVLTRPFSRRYRQTKPPPRDTTRTRRAAEAEVTPLERALEAALRRDEVAAEIERQARQEELADAFLSRRRCRRRPRRRQHRSPNSRSRGSSIFESLACFTTAGERSGGDDDDLGDETAAAALAAAEYEEREGTPFPYYTHTSPLLLPTMAWGFRVFAEACRRSRGTRRLAAARKTRAEAERRVVLGEAFAAWAVEAALVRDGREARRRRAAETARLCLARWKVFVAFEAR